MSDTHNGTLIVDLTAAIDNSLNHLGYASYREQRRRFPETSSERWARIFPQGELFERWYQEEQAK